MKGLHQSKLDDEDLDLAEMGEDGVERLAHYE